MKRILVIQTAFLGDVILATPVVTEVKRLFPDILIDVLVKSGNEQLITSHPDINDVLIFTKKEGKWKSLFALIRTIRKNNYDVVINLHRFGSSGLLTLFSGAKETRGFSKNPFSYFFTKRFSHEIGNGLHEVERNLSLIQDWGVQKRVRPSLFPTDTDFERIRSFQNNPYVVLAPASIWFTKQLPVDQWVQLIHQLDQTIYLIGGVSDLKLCEQIQSKCPAQSIEILAGKLTLMQSAALISGAQRTFVNDSGPLHIASAMNAPVTAFFCSTIPAFGFGPLSDDSKIIQTEEELNCRPCGLHGHQSCPKGHFRCAYGIQIKLD